MTISIADSAADQNGGSTAIQPSFGSNIVAGEAIITLVGYEAGSNIGDASVSDPIGGAHTKAASDFLSNRYCAVFYKLAHAGGTADVDITIPSSAAVWAHTYRVSSDVGLQLAGSSAIALGANPGIATDGVATAAMNITGPKGLILAMGTAFNASAPAVGTGFSAGEGPVFFGTDRGEYRAIAAPGSFAATWSNADAGGAVRFVLAALALQEPPLATAKPWLHYARMMGAP